MTTRRWMFTNPELYATLFDSVRSAAWEAIEYLSSRLHFRLQNTQKYLEELKEIEEELEALKKVRLDDLLSLV